ncbi:MAG: hypothetical protein HY907_16925 [Deltaproteobacteria bacterium]|nr:hypothetical protein [Deltaproteobacteria bacterium]
MTGPRLRRDRSYLYWRQTPSWCVECGTRVPGRIVSEGKRVYLERACPTHGHSRGLLAESLEFWQARMLRPARRAPATTRRDAPPECPRDCHGPCSWHEGPVRRLIAPASAPAGPPAESPDALPDALPALPDALPALPDALPALPTRLRAAGEPLEDVVTGEAAEGEAFLAVGRMAPDDEALSRWMAGLASRPGVRRAWIEATDGLPLDVLGARVARAVGVDDAGFEADADAPMCLSRTRLPGTDIPLVLHAPMQAATLDLTRLLTCPVWTWTADGAIVPACWGRIRAKGTTDGHR